MAEIAHMVPPKRSNTVSLLPKLVLLLVGVLLLIASQRSTQATQAATGALRGTVSIGAHGDPSIVSGAKVIVTGDTSIRSALTDQEGKFAMDALEPGIYLVEASYFGLHTQMNVKVEAGSVAQVALQLDTAEDKR